MPAGVAPAAGLLSQASSGRGRAAALCSSNSKSNLRQHWERHTVTISSMRAREATCRQSNGCGRILTQLTGAALKGASSKYRVSLPVLSTKPPSSHGWAWCAAHCRLPSPVGHAPVLKSWPVVAPLKHRLALSCGAPDDLTLHLDSHLVAGHLQAGQAVGWLYTCTPSQTDSLSTLQPLGERSLVVAQPNTRNSHDILHTDLVVWQLTRRTSNECGTSSHTSNCKCSCK